MLMITDKCYLSTHCNLEAFLRDKYFRHIFSRKIHILTVNLLKNTKSNKSENKLIPHAIIQYVICPKLAVSVTIYRPTVDYIHADTSTNISLHLTNFPQFITI